MTEEKKLCEICEWESGASVEAVGDWCLGAQDGKALIVVTSVQ